jgi:hypothetical protein
MVSLFSISSSSSSFIDLRSSINFIKKLARTFFAKIPVVLLFRVPFEGLFFPFYCKPPICCEMPVFTCVMYHLTNFLLPHNYCFLQFKLKIVYNTSYQCPIRSILISKVNGLHKYRDFWVCVKIKIFCA